MVGSPAAYALQRGLPGARTSGSLKFLRTRVGEGTCVERLGFPGLPQEVRETGTEVGDVMRVPEELKPGPLLSVSRNAALQRALPGLRVPHARKTGTTIAGLVFQVSRELGWRGLEGRREMGRGD